jgi:hypothetical protein
MRAESPAQVTVLAEFLEKLPPMIARKKVSYFTGGLVAPKTLRNEDCKGVGPRERMATPMGTVYPTAYLLEWMERKGVTVISAPRL